MEAKTNAAAGSGGIDWMALLKKYGIIIVLLLMIAVLSVVRPQFRSSQNIFNVLTQSAIFGIMALIYFIVCFTLSQIVRAYQRRLKEARAA